MEPISIQKNGAVWENHAAPFFTYMIDLILSLSVTG